MKTILSFILYSFYALILVGLTLLFIAPPLPGLGALDVKIVKSGSMEPNIMTGAVVVIREVGSYGLGDIITFTSEGANIPTTHRIVGTEEVDGKEYFVTKGDANEERDTNVVAPSDILGKVVIDVPYLGFILDFAHQPIGFALLIGVPAFLIIFDELHNIWRETGRIRRVKITKNAITPLVVSPYLPISGSSLETSENSVEKSSTEQTDVKKFVVSQIVIKKDSKLKTDKVARYRYSDIQPKLMVATSVLVLVFANQFNSGDSFAYPIDIEASSNYLKAQAVDFTISPNNSTFIITDGSFVGGDTVDVEVNSEMDLVYDVKVEAVGGSVALCNDLSVSADNPLAFNGSVTGLNGATINFNSPWHLDFSLTNNSAYTSADNCEADIVFTGHSTNFNDGGYDDEERVRINFVIGESELPLLESVQNLNIEESVVPVEEDLTEENKTEEVQDEIDETEPVL